MKKINKILMGVGLSLCMATAGMAVGCGDKPNTPASMSINDVFAMGMVSASNYLSNAYAGGIALNASREVSDETKGTIKEYTRMFEGLLNNGIRPTKTANSDAQYEYLNKLTMTLGDKTYVMYYNEVTEGSTTELDEDKIEVETTSFLEGRVVVGEDEYYVVGSREIESETKKNITELENELKLIFSTTALDVNNSAQFDSLEDNLPNNCVVIEQESEEGEIEFKYTTKNGSNVKSVEIEFENDGADSELEIEIEEGTGKVEYKIRKVDANKYAIRLKEDGNKTLLYLEKVDDEWVFTTTNN